MRTPVIDIPLHKLIAVAFATVGICAELFVAGVMLLNRQPVGFGVREILVCIVLVLGITALLPLPFLYRGREWARGAAALSISLISIAVITLLVVSIASAPRDVSTYVVTGGFAASVTFTAIAALLFLLNRKVAEGMKVPEEPNQSVQTRPTSRPV